VGAKRGRTSKSKKVENLRGKKANSRYIGESEQGKIDEQKSHNGFWETQERDTTYLGRRRPLG